MSLCFQCATYLLCFLFVGTSCQYLRTNAVFGVGKIREKRQAGYVYDRPTISFNLPSQKTVASTSTQGTNVDRTLAQQMYYAYPAPAGGGYSNTGSSESTSTATSGTAGYNYNSAVQNTATGSTKGSTSTVTTGSGSSGYNYGANSQSSDSASNVGITAVTTGSGAGGGRGSGGYRYSGSVQNTASGSTEGSSSTITASSESGSSGYSYSGAVNTVSGSIGSLGTVTTGGTSGSIGYNYETQNTGNGVTQTVTNAVSNLYNVPSSRSTNTVVSVDNISTNAPEYLPPTSVGGSVGVSVTTNSQAVSGSPVVTPSDTYIPPVQRTPSLTTTQIGANAPSVNIGTQTYNAPTSGPSVSYLQPSKLQQTNSVQNTQTQVTGQATRPIQAPTPDYIPPVVNSGTKISVSTPAATYLPPIF